MNWIYWILGSAVWLILSCVFIFRWRWGMYGLIAYLPFAGLPTILLYPAPPVTTLLKDFLFVIPAYVGFLLWFLTRAPATRPAIRHIPWDWLVAFGAIVVLQVLNPSLENLLVGLIGIKVKLFYVPLCFLGYYFVDSQRRLMTVAGLILWIGVIPAVVGLVQGAFVYSGHADLAYAWYGRAGESVTQGFAALGVVEGTSLKRIPSTFTFVTQYSSHLLALLPIAYALSLSSTAFGRRRRTVAILCLGIVTAAALTSGSRSMFVVVPGFFVSATLLLQGSKKFRSLMKLGAFGFGGFLLLAAFLGLSSGDLSHYVNQTATGYLSGSSEVSVWSEFGRSLGQRWIGQGVGMSTGPARKASTLRPGDGTPPFEGYYAATFAELGMVGLFIVVALLLALLVDGWRSLTDLHDPRLRGFGVSLWAVLFIVVIYLLKGSLLDYDPLNVYFWLYTGILARLPTLQAANSLTPLSAHSDVPILSETQYTGTPCLHG